MKRHDGRIFRIRTFRAIILAVLLGLMSSASAQDTPAAKSQGHDVSQTVLQDIRIPRSRGVLQYAPSILNTLLGGASRKNFRHLRGLGQPCSFINRH